MAHSMSYNIQQAMIAHIPTEILFYPNQMIGLLQPDLKLKSTQNYYMVLYKLMKEGIVKRNEEFQYKINDDKMDFWKSKLEKSIEKNTIPVIATKKTVIKENDNDLILQRVKSLEEKIAIIAAAICSAGRNIEDAYASGS